MARDSLKVKPEFGEAVKRVLDERQWSLRNAMIHTGVNHATIYNMTQGLVPSMEQVITWARALGDDLNVWLTLAGYEQIPSDLVSPRPKIEVPDSVRKLIAEAPSREEKIEEAFRFIRSDRTYKFGSSIMGSLPTEAKLGIIRLYEETKHVRLLPEGLT